MKTTQLIINKDTNLSKHRIYVIKAGCSSSFGVSSNREDNFCVTDIRSCPSIYLDLESPTDRERLSNAELYLPLHEDKLVILDEIQQMRDICKP